MKQILYANKTQMISINKFGFNNTILIVHIDK